MGREIIEWMKTQVFAVVTYYDCWIKPMESLNAGTVCACRPPGNGPELMRWDASLNKDVDDCAAGRHVAFCLINGIDRHWLRQTVH